MKIKVVDQDILYWVWVRHGKPMPMWKFKKDVDQDSEFERQRDENIKEEI